MVLSKRWERSFMKVRIELDPSTDEPEILIRAPRLTPELTQLQERILEQKVAPLAFYKDRSEYFLDVASILFLRRMGRRFLDTPRMRPMRSSRSSMSWRSCFPSPFVGFPNPPLSTQSRSTLWKSLFQGPARSISTRPISRSTYLDATINS